ELRFHLDDSLHALLLVGAIQVPPTGAVGDEEEAAVRSPFWLEERPRAGYTSRPDNCAPAIQVGHTELGLIPGHVRVVPGEPAEAAAVRSEPRRREKVMPRNQHLLLARIETDGGDCIHGFAGAGVVLAHRDQPSSLLVENEVRVPHAINTAQRP